MSLAVFIKKPSYTEACHEEAWAENIEPLRGSYEAKWNASLHIDGVVKQYQTDNASVQPC